MMEKDLGFVALDKVIKYMAKERVKLRRLDFDKNEEDWLMDSDSNIRYKNCIKMIRKDEEIIGVLVKITYTGRWEKQLKLAKERFYKYPNVKMEENHLAFAFTIGELQLPLDEKGGEKMKEDVCQLNLFDMMQCSMEIPMADEEGCILSDKLVPIRWEGWKHTTASWKNCGHDGKPHIIDAFLVVLPGNRLYVKEWFTYPFMHELKSSDEVNKMYSSVRKKIMEWAGENTERRWTWQIDKLPRLKDMWKFKEGVYSCKEYTDKTIYGYRR